MVPAVFEPWAKDLLDAAAPRPGMRVLDVACGTGIVARLAASRVGPAGRVAALDANESMLAIARAQASGTSIEWRSGDAARLPFGDREFDRVLCQQGLQYFPDRLAALREMKRVLKPDGRLALSVFRSSLGHETLRRAAAPYVGEPAAAIVMEPFNLPRAAELAGLLEQAGLPVVRMQRKTFPARFAAIDDFIEYQLAGRLASAAAKLADGTRRELVVAMRAAFAPYSGPRGVEFPMEANVVLAGS